VIRGGGICPSERRALAIIAAMQTLGVDGRRLGGALAVFGSLGVALAGIVAVALVVGGLSIRSLADDLEATRLAFVDSLERTSASMSDAATATANLGATLGSTETTLVDTSTTLADLAGAVDSLAGALDFSILGQQPLLGAAEGFAGVADRLRTFSGDLDAVAVDLVANQADLGEITADLRDLQAGVDALAERVDAFDRTEQLVATMSWGLVLLGAVAAWIAAAGAIAAWIGWRLRQIAGGDSRDGDPGVADPSQPGG
jgi:hypothetical protein